MNFILLQSTMSYKCAPNSTTSMRRQNKIEQAEQEILQLAPEPRQMPALYT